MLKITLLLLLLPLISFSQESIRGIVCDVDDTPIGNITVQLLNGKDSSVIAKAETDKTGRFIIRDSSIKFPCILTLSFKQGNKYDCIVSRPFMDSTPIKIVIQSDTGFYKLTLLLERLMDKIKKQEPLISDYRLYLDSFDLKFREQSTYQENIDLKVSLTKVIKSYDDLTSQLNRLKEMMYNVPLEKEKIIAETVLAKANLVKIDSLISSVKLIPHPVFRKYIVADTCRCIQTDDRNYIELELFFTKSEFKQEVRVHLFELNINTGEELLIPLKGNKGIQNNVVQNIEKGMYKSEFKLVTEKAFKKKKNSHFFVHFEYGQRFRERYIFTLESVDHCTEN
jgi:5-hydroxyisourate hydrolase-like protein (transthyretin family)